MWRRLNSSSARFSSSPGGSSACSRSVSTAQRGALVGVELRIRLATPAGCVNTYSSASIPPHDEPNRWIRSSPSPSRTLCTCSTKVSTVQSDGSSGREDSPLPSWSKKTTRRPWLGQRRERGQRSVRPARSAVKAEQWQPSGFLAVAEDEVAPSPSRGTGGWRSVDRPRVARVEQLAEVALALFLHARA